MMVEWRAMVAIGVVAILAGISGATSTLAAGDSVGKPRETRQAVESRCVEIGDRITAQVFRLKTTDTFTSSIAPWLTTITLQLAEDGDDFSLECETYGRVSLSIRWDGTVLPPPHLPAIFVAAAAAMLGIPVERVNQALDACRRAKGRDDVKRDGVTLSCYFDEENRSGWAKASKPWAAIDRDAAAE